MVCILCTDRIEGSMNRQKLSLLNGTFTKKVQNISIEINFMYNFLCTSSCHNKHKQY